MKAQINRLLSGIGVAAALLFGAIGMSAQNSLPAPGSGGSFNPGGGGGGGFGGPGFGGGPAFAPTPPPPTYWGSPWYDGWNDSPTVVISPSVSVGNFENQGTRKVIACGYDAEGIWRVLPLYVSYQYTGAQYHVNVLNAWNPYTDSWDKGIDEQAYNTDYRLKGVDYNFYTVLPFGTFYFNL